MCNCTQLKQGMNHYDIDTQVKILIACGVSHTYLQEYQSSDEISIVCEHENIVTNDIDQKMTQSNCHCRETLKLNYSTFRKLILWVLLLTLL